MREEVHVPSYELGLRTAREIYVRDLEQLRTELRSEFEKLERHLTPCEAYLVQSRAEDSTKLENGSKSSILDGVAPKVSLHLDRWPVSPRREV